MWLKWNRYWEEVQAIIQRQSNSDRWGVAQASRSLFLAAATAGDTSRGGGGDIVVDVRGCLTQTNGYYLTTRESAVGEKPGLGNP